MISTAAAAISCVLNLFEISLECCHIGDCSRQFRKAEIAVLSLHTPHAFMTGWGDFSVTLPANSTCSLTFSSALSESLACIVSFFSLQIFLLVRGLITGFARHLCLFRGKPQAVQFWQLRFLLDCKTTVLNRTITCPHVHTRLLLAHNNPHFAHDFLGVCTWGNSSAYFFSHWSQWMTTRAHPFRQGHR